jgi:DNA-binding NarL/FixJ family response regulator
MQLWRRLVSNLPSNGGHLSLQVSAVLAERLRQLAARERTSLQALAETLLQEGVAQRLAAGRSREQWQTLSAREQEVSALVCLYYTNRQIASRLNLSDDTVKAHVRNICLKFGLHGREQLRQALAGWDFGSWDERPL